jgi:hypothetical protein
MSRPKTFSGGALHVRSLPELITGARVSRSLWMERARHFMAQGNLPWMHHCTRWACDVNRHLIVCLGVDREQRMVPVPSEPASLCTGPGIQAFAQQHGPAAMRRLIELVSSKNDATGSVQP